MKKIFFVLPLLAALMTGVCGCSDNAGIQEEYSALQEEYEALQADYSALKDEYDSLAAEYESGKTELDNARSDVIIVGNALGSVAPSELDSKKAELKGVYEFNYVPAAAAEPEYSSAAAESAEYSYIGNKNSHKFHKPTCSTLPNPENRVYFSSRDEAVNSGYDACKRCNP